ncbi:hypothetical protein AB0F25_27990 [Streptomyces wedmorensis]|uniref:hypothetical protein n=1 Tax=Streptomyces wedmorensis TaxID=43759 RepID=UPI00341EDBA0
MPDQLANEVEAWVTVLRGEGRRRHPARSYRCIRTTLSTLLSTLATWADNGVVSLREVTEEDVTQAARVRSGARGGQLDCALRILFRALKQERVIFHDPARRLRVRRSAAIPRSVPSDLLPLMFSQAKSAFARLTIALVAVHALNGEEIRALLLTNVDLAHGTLTVRHRLKRRVVGLEPFTHQLIADWLTERHVRWPASTNPHLLVTGRTALSATGAPPDATTIRGVFPKGMNLDALRQDRILDEARSSIDPLRLMRLFGISDSAAMRYISAAHPERTSKLPK